MRKAVLLWLHSAWPLRKHQDDVVRGYKRRFGDLSGIDMEDFKTFCFVYDTTAVAGDPQQTAMHEGRRQAFIHITQMLEVNAEDLKLLEPKEQTDDRDPSRPADTND